MYTLSDILDQIQELMGQPQGSFYNMESRMRAIQATHDSLVRETGALIRRGKAEVVEGETVVNSFPDDFLAFSGSPIVFQRESQQSEAPGVVWGDVKELTVVSPRDMDSMYRLWDSAPVVDDPHSIVVRSPRHVELYPSPRFSGVLEFSYISRGETPEDYLETGRDPLDWVPFDGEIPLNRFANVIAYKVASDLLLARNTELAAYVRSLYDKGVREMRHAIRYDPAKDIHVAPKARDGRYAYAARRY